MKRVSRQVLTNTHTQGAYGGESLDSPTAECASLTQLLMLSMYLFLQILSLFSRLL